MIAATPSIARALRTTPIRHLLRGRVSRSLDWRLPITQAALPDPIPALIERVVKRTRLFRDEKTDVARELVAHFTDAIREGASPESAAKDFGDPRTAAKLIARAKKRARPPFRKACMRIFKVLGVVLLLVLGLYLIEFVRFNTAKPTITRNYSAEYNAEVDAISMDQRAWPVYRQAALTLYPLTNDQRISIGTTPRDPEWETQLEVFADRAEALDLFREASARPHLGYHWTDAEDPEIALALDPGRDVPMNKGTDNPMVISILLPSLSVIRTGAQLLAADATHAAMQGDADRALANIHCLVSMASHTAPSKTLVEELVDISIFNVALAKTTELLWDHPSLFSDDQLTDLAHTLATYRGGGRITLSLEAEHQFWDDIIQRIYTDDGSGDGRLTASGLRTLTSIEGDIPPTFDATAFVGPIATRVVAGRKAMNDKYDLLISDVRAFSELPLCQQVDRGGPDEFTQFFYTSQEKLRYAPIYALLPALERAGRNGWYTQLARDATLAAISAERFRRDTGAFPASLETLVPRYLPAVPEDYFDCNPLSYEIRSDRPFIYSVGHDQTDHAGEIYRTPLGHAEPHRAKNQDTEGFDWVIFPPSSYWASQPLEPIAPGVR